MGLVSIGFSIRTIRRMKETERHIERLEAEDAAKRRRAGAR
jgi:hypothetical protein